MKTLFRGTDIFLIQGNDTQLVSGRLIFRMQCQHSFELGFREVVFLEIEIGVRQGEMRARVVRTLTDGRLQLGNGLAAMVVLEQFYPATGVDQIAAGPVEPSAAAVHHQPDQQDHRHPSERLALGSNPGDQRAQNRPGN